jgi:hypothetical protein
MMQKESKKADTKCRFLWPNHPNYAYFSYQVWSQRDPGKSGSIYTTDEGLPKSIRISVEADRQLRQKFGSITHSPQAGSSGSSKFALLGQRILGSMPVSSAPFIKYVEALVDDCSQSNIQVGSGSSFVGMPC